MARVRPASVRKGKCSRKHFDCITRRVIEHIRPGDARVVGNKLGDMRPGIAKHIHRFAANRQQDVDLGMLGWTPLSHESPVSFHVEVPPAATDDHGADEEDVGYDEEWAQRKDSPVGKDTFNLAEDQAEITH